MSRQLQQRVLETLQRHEMFSAGERIGVGVSGGADSVALLRIFDAMRAHLGVSLVVLHFHHQLRGADADSDEAFVVELAHQLNIECVTDRADVAAIAARNGWNIEDAARRLRYEFFAKTAESHNLSCVAVAHTADDQAETVLAHILRGTGTTGLAGIYPVAGQVIRPLLELRRQELREYLAGLNQAWREDLSNQDTSRVRARIRHNLIPALETEFESAVVPRLARLAGLAREEESFWKALLDERFASLARRPRDGQITIAADDLLSPCSELVHTEPTRPQADSPSLAVSRRLVRRICFELQESRRQISARHVQDVLHLAAASQSGARLELPGINVERIFNQLTFSATLNPNRTSKLAEGAEPRPEFAYAIEPPPDSNIRSIAVPEIRRRFTLKVVDWSARSRETKEEQGSLDFDSLRWPITVRNWQPGDAYRPHRRLRAHKLKHLLLQARIPANRRIGWPVFTCKGELIWAPGFPAAEKFSPSPETRLGLVIAEVDF